MTTSGARRVRAASEKVSKLDGAHDACFDHDALDARMSQNGRAVCARVERVFKDEPFGILDLRVVVEGRAF